MSENTPYPGKAIPYDDAKPIISNFVTQFRGSLYINMPDNVPTACTLSGVKNKDIWSNSNLNLLQSVYVLIEPDELNKASGEEVIKFVSNKEPWEDYDLCIFDESLNWCIGVTHNDDVLVVDPKNILQKK